MPARLRLPALGAALAASLAAAAPAAATTGPPSFWSPSHNIVCARHVGGISCFVAEPAAEPPASCDLAWIPVAHVRRTGRAGLRWDCRGDIPFLYATPPHTLAYGSHVTWLGVTCWSRRTGMRCANRAHHGFVLSRSVARRF